MIESVPSDKLSQAVVTLLDRVDAMLSESPKLYRFEAIRPPALAAVWTAALMDDATTSESLARLVATCSGTSATKSIVTASQIA